MLSKHLDDQGRQLADGAESSAKPLSIDSIASTDLERLRYLCSRPSLSPDLSTVVRAAALRGAEAELRDRATQSREHHRVGSQLELLAQELTEARAALAERKAEIEAMDDPRLIIEGGSDA